MYSQEEDMDRQAEEPGMNTWEPLPDRKLTKEEEEALTYTFGEQFRFYRVRAGLNSHEALCTALKGDPEKIKDLRLVKAYVALPEKEEERLYLNRNQLGEWENNQTVPLEKYVKPLVRFFRLTKTQSRFFWIEYDKNSARVSLQDAHDAVMASQQRASAQQTPTSEPRREDVSGAPGRTYLAGDHPWPHHRWSLSQSRVTLVSLNEPVVVLPPPQAAPAIPLSSSAISVTLPSPPQFWRSRALTWVLFSAIAILALALALSTSVLGWAYFHTSPPPLASPASAILKLERVGPCTWIVWLEGHHFHRYSHLTVVIPKHTSTDCQTGTAQVTEESVLTEGTVSAKGVWGPQGFAQTSFGTYQYVMSDDAGPNHTVGHCVRLTITYDKNTVPWPSGAPRTVPYTTAQCAPHA